MRHPPSAQAQNEIVRRGYDRLSYAYRSDDTPDDYGPYAEWVGLLAARLPAGAPVLDVGCGCGLPATRLLARHFEVTGVDLSAVQIERAKRLVPAARFVCGDVMEQTFETESFAAVVSFYAIIHMPLATHPALFGRIAQWLRPAGWLLATVGHDAWTGVDDAYLGVSGGTMVWSQADAATNVRWCEAAGLRVSTTAFVPDGDSGHALILAQKPLVRPRESRCADEDHPPGG